MMHRWLNMAPNERFGAVLDRYRGAGPGFDVLRIVLAFAIFYGHAKWAAGLSGMEITQVAAQATAATHGAGLPGAVAAGGEVQGWTGFTKPLKLALVPMFFSLSGFLVMGSAVRLRVTSTFLAFRALRIFPALMVEVVLSGFVLGAALTTLPIMAYYSHPEFLGYMLNAVGDISFVLPGVFAHNPVRYVVNVNLWTLPSEFYCYLLMAALMLTRVVYQRAVFTGTMIVVTIGLAAAHFLTGMSYRTPYPPHVIVYYFAAGILFYHWKDRIPANFWLFCACLPLMYVLLMDPRFMYLAPLPLVYATVFTGLIPFPRFALLSSGDYSYGVYLYGFPITQSLIAVWPGLFVGHLTILMLAATPLTFLFAALSWHGVEKHALAYKKLLPVRWFPVPNRKTASPISEAAITHRGTE
jgi:peptidoglycan/LPS O-acetylase OafA/YrhL